MSRGQQTAITIEAALVEIDERVLHLFAMVSEGLGAATAAFLAGDCDVARRLVAADVNVDSLEIAIEDLVHNRLVRGPTVAIDVLLPFVAILRIVPELERSGDLVEHITLRTPQGMAEQLSPRARGLILEMGEVGVDMWRAAADTYAERDLEAATRLRVLDDHLDDLHVRLSAELAQNDISTSVAIEMG
ncbi:MAG: phosphate transport system protein [Acidimicrobiaceae bacterium]|jgi:phosphate transport system protein|nr:phosphate transport system protein [Acidimicrobiaceae bacterium]